MSKHSKLNAKSAAQIVLSLLTALFGCQASSGTWILNFGEINYSVAPGWQPVKVAYRVVDLPQTPPPIPPRPPVQLPPPNPWEPPIVLHGLDGRVFLLANGYSWIRGRPRNQGVGAMEERADEALIEFFGHEQPESRVLGFFLSQGLQNQFRHSTDVIAVGLSSCEGEWEDEHERAAKRAGRLVDWLRRCHPDVDLPNLRYWVWTWGRHEGDCAEESVAERTREQRSVMVIAVQRHDGEQLVESVLVDSLDRLAALPVRVRNYPRRERLQPVNF